MKAIIQNYIDTVKAEKARKMDIIKSEVGATATGTLVGGGLLVAVISVVVTIIVLARAVPVLWPLATEASGNVTAMTGTDAGTTTIVAFWPIALLLIGLGIAIGLIIYALNKFGIMG